MNYNINGAIRVLLNHQILARGKSAYLENTDSNQKHDLDDQSSPSSQPARTYEWIHQLHIQTASNFVSFHIWL